MSLALTSSSFLMPTYQQENKKHVMRMKTVNQHSEDVDSIFLNNQKIILPLKEYSNKFFRQNKLSENYSFYKNIIKKKKSVDFSKDQTKTKLKKLSQNKQNFVNHIVTESSSIQNCSKRYFFRSASSSTKKKLQKDKIQKMSTSRALQMFSKVFRNDNIQRNQRTKIRRQIANITTDFHVKQVILKQKMQKSNNKLTTLNAIKKILNCEQFSQQNRIIKKPKKIVLTKNDDNYEIVGW